MKQVVIIGQDVDILVLLTALIPDDVDILMLKQGKGKVKDRFYSSKDLQNSNLVIECTHILDIDYHYCSQLMINVISETHILQNILSKISDFTFATIMMSQTAVIMLELLMLEHYYPTPMFFIANTGKKMLVRLSFCRWLKM
ncbi:hypothetical protein AVEN_119822-1 [Araneus ventricosus]|uniref:Uncharacterized protein n=1 Tax=Araneus ventricosus TaxID=182803 RepID=A0A4Y2MUV0_ARAVE|nr:hypothetical protein AVEN_119822-1 [Araneus ventricosus]